MAQFKFYLNRQGVRGAKGEKGDKGFSPSVAVGKNTQEEFTLFITNEDETIETPNIKEGLVPEDRGGTYVRKDPETGLQYYGDANIGTFESSGEVQLASTDDLKNTELGDVEPEQQPAKGKAVEGLSAIEFFASNDSLSTAKQDIKNLQTEVNACTDRLDAHTDDIMRLTNEQTVQDSKIEANTQNIEKVNTGLNGKQNKLVAGGNVTLTDNADGTTTVSSAGGGGTGDVTAAGNNTFTGRNNFRTESSRVPYYTDIGFGDIKTLNTDIIFRRGTANSWNQTGAAGTMDDGTAYLLGSNGIKLARGSSGKLIVGNYKTSDATDKIVLDQGNVEAGDNVTIEQTTDGIKISATGGGGESPNNVVTTDTDQTITGIKEFNATQNFINAPNLLAGLNFKVSLDDRMGFASILRTTGDNIVLHPYYGCSSQLVVNREGVKFIDIRGIDHDIYPFSGGSTPSNMVTTDTLQTITASKTFSKSTKFGDYLTISSNDSGANVYCVVNGSAHVNHLNVAAKSAQCWAFNNDPRYSTSDTGEGSSQLANYEPYLRKGNITVGDGINIEETRDSYNTITGIKISATGGGRTSTSNNGTEGDYKVKHGIVDCPNGLVEFTSTSRDITIKNGIVLNCAGNGNAKTTIATAISHTLTSPAGDITLFYAEGTILECGKVDWSETEPEDNGVDNYQAWFNPNKTANPDSQWQFKSNETGNVWRTVNSATPFVDLTLSASGVTSARYMGYRILDDDVLVTTENDILIKGNKKFAGGIWVANTNGSESEPAVTLDQGEALKYSNGSIVGKNIQVGSSYGSPVVLSENTYMMSTDNYTYDTYAYKVWNASSLVAGDGINFVDNMKQLPDGKTQAIGKKITLDKSDFEYVAGDILTNTSLMILPSLLTSSKSQILIGLVTPKSLKNITTIKATKLTGSIRVPSGGYVPAINTNFLTESDSVLVQKATDNMLFLRFDKSGGWATSDPNNVPLVVQFSTSDLILEFS